MVPALAQFRVEVSGVGLTQLPIALAPFKGEDASPQKISTIVQADLERSGQFRGVDASGQALDETSRPDLSLWRQRTADSLVVGSVTRLADGRYDVRFRLWDVVRGQDLGGQSFTVPQGDLRLASHRIADYVYEKLTGEKGIFSTRIAYVTKGGNRYSLWVADADGENAQAALASPEPIISPRWSSNGTQLAYVSFESRKPVVYVHNVASGQRRLVANFRGSNSAPAWAPDGRSLAVALSKDGLTQIYRIPATGGTPQRLTDSSGIDTNPNFSPDGQWIAFTSDRGGSPQIYRMPASGGPAQRLTFEGTYNVAPRYSPDGKSIAFVQREGGRFRIANLELSTGQVTVLTDGTLDDSPTFAPNGKMILYEAQVGGRGQLAAVSGDGRVRQRLTSAAGDVQDPAWGPMPTN